MARVDVLDRTSSYIFRYRRFNFQTSSSVIVLAVRSCSRSIIFRFVMMWTSTPRLRAERRAVVTGGEVRFGVRSVIDLVA